MSTQERAIGSTYLVTMALLVAFLAALWVAFVGATDWRRCWGAFR
jgi:hypothetical protein